MTAAVIRGFAKPWLATTRTVRVGRPGVLLQATRSQTTSNSDSDKDKGKHIAEKSDDVPEAIGFDVGFRDGYEAGFNEGRRRVEAASKNRSAPP
ncbi:hypothetical protein IW136_004374, partial [Coemansia sp. RSA 678]